MRPRNPDEERTCFQEAAEYIPQIDSRADVAIVYGVNPTFEQRVVRWRQAGYRIHVMTGVAWGDYTDYVRGEWDGILHFDDAQTAVGNFRLEHGISQGRDIYYMMPSLTYTRYLSEKLRRVVDSGALAIHLEEPEFWIRAGYGKGFEREWQEFYGEAWVDPITSPDARYRCSKLQHFLYTRTLEILFRDLKQYAAEKGNPDLKCYVPTHSLVNYAHWQIVSPESNLLSIPDCDGIIGQVWTGTSRTPNVYRGVRRQRTFEAGYCEYAACVGMVRGTGKKLWQLADPIEDDPNYCWADYRENWECTVTASLLSPESQQFEIMPWPARIFMRQYPTVNLGTLPLQRLLESYTERMGAAGKTDLVADTRRAVDLFGDFYRKQTGFAESDILVRLSFKALWEHVHDFYKILASREDQQDAQRLRSALSAFYHDAAPERAAIPADYATELQVVFNALADIPGYEKTEWIAGLSGVGLAVSDTLMYQRDEPQASDADLSSYYGLAMPLVKNGVALEMVQLERVNEPGYLDKLHLILLTYEGQKPPSPAAHQALAQWVQQGNGLILFGSGDAYNSVREWWNQGGMHYDRPQDHLTEILGLGQSPEAGLHECGEGIALIDPYSPSQLAHENLGGRQVLSQVFQALRRLDLSDESGNALALRRGPYMVAAGMDEAEAGIDLVLDGIWVDLYDPNLAIRVNPQIRENTRWLLYDVETCPAYAWVVAAAGRVMDERCTDHLLTCRVEGMEQTVGVLRAKLPSPSTSACVDGNPAFVEWDELSHTVLLRFTNHPEGVEVMIAW